MLYRGFMCRDVNYYKKLQKIKNLVFVDYKKDSFNLIDNSQFIISVKGSILESVVRNKHAIVLGNTWHEMLNGVHKMNNIQFLNNFISEKAYMKKISHNNIIEDLEKVSSKYCRIVISYGS